MKRCSGGSERGGLLRHVNHDSMTHTPVNFSKEKQERIPVVAMAFINGMTLQATQAFQLLATSKLGRNQKFV